jgi:pyruvate dehydrogenase E2 component (dihydrolipoamide acetyltransferase)
MATEVKLPRLGQGMESGTIVRWLKEEGESVKRRDPLYELDTDKVTQEVEAEADGVLLKILVPSGEVDVGTTIGMIGKEGEEVAVTESPRPEPPAAESPPAESPSVESPPADPSPEESPVAESASAAQPEPSEPTVVADERAPVPPGDGSDRASVQSAAGGVDATGRVKASPLARRIARERGVDLAAVTGTGPDGRIVAEDVENAATATPAPVPVTAEPPADVEVVQLTSVRKTIARRLTEAWAAPVFQLVVSADMTEALALRERLVGRVPEGHPKPTVNDVLVKLSAAALMRHPPVNATFTGDEVHRYATANVGIAVAAPAGLMVPVVRSAERLTIQEIARVRSDLVSRARDGKLTLQDFEAGTFTISNLGMFGVEQFVAVLNPPQVAILAVGAVKPEAVVVEGQIDVAPILRMTLTCDHRAIDGAEGADFLRTLVALVEEPALAL